MLDWRGPKGTEGDVLGSKRPRATDALQAGLDRLPVGFALFDAKRRLVAWNAALASICRYAKSLLKQGAPLSAFETLRPKANKPREERLPDGRVIRISSRRVPQGRLLFVCEDVTEARLAEERYDVASRAVNEGIYDWDIANDRVYYSERVYQAVGMSPDDYTTAKGWRDHIHPDDLSRYDAALVAHFKGRTDRFECDYRFRTRDGSWRWARQHGIAMRDAQGRAVRLIGSTGDITELKERERELAEKTAILETTLEHIDQGITMVDKDLRTMALNRRFLELLDFPPERFGRGFHMEEAFRFNAERGEYGPGDVEEQVRSRVELARRFEPHAFERTRPDGKVIAVRGKPIPGGGFVSTYTDVTENVLLIKQIREALERQTGTAEILHVIAKSPTDVQPVFEAIAESGMRLFGSWLCTVLRYDGKLIHFGATRGALPDSEQYVSGLFPRPADRQTVVGRAILECSVQNLADTLSDSSPGVRELSQKRGFRSVLSVPMVRDGKPVGVINVARKEAGDFSDVEVELLKTFADQAVIAIENVRLFNEISDALQQQTATADVLKAISRTTFDLETVLKTLLDSASRLTGAESALLMRPDGSGNYLPAVTYNVPPDSPFLARLRERPVRPGRDSTVGRALLERRVIHVPDVHSDPEYGRRDLAAAGGFRSVAAVPMLRDGEPLGLIAFNKDEAPPFTDKQLALMSTFADQAAIAIENVRLFRELEDKSAQLEVASRHKSQFLANMSHELRTPLNAILGFSEALGERYFGELTEKQDEYVKDIHGSGKHLLSLINDILDLSKIEAGRMELELSDFDLPAALGNAITLVKERAQRHGVVLTLETAPGIGTIRADERKFKQIMLNLLSNAVKFTPEGGAVGVSAKPNGSGIEISVADTGPGIAPEDQAAIFEEFKQVGPASARKAEGTGLGLPLTKRFIELHGGEIRLESAPGKGSTFRFTIPLRVPAVELR